MSFNDILALFLNSDEIEIIFKVLLAVCFGALIGLEREHAHRPAGLRTHILVCVGACLVMLTSKFVYNYYHQFSPNMDITRLGAQVISGIGFLGAGTIIRNGSSVKGLTTAASLWTVACVGLATGIGFYFGATVTTLIIFLCLAYIKKFSDIYTQKKATLTITSETSELNNIVVYVESLLANNSIKKNGISVRSLKDTNSEMSFQLSMNEDMNPALILGDINTLKGVLSVNLSSKKIIKDEE